MKKNRGRVIPLDPALRKSRRAGGRAPLKSENIKKARFRKQTENIKEYKRGKSIKRSTTIVAGLFFVFVLVYLVRTLFAFFTTPEIPVDMVRMGSIDTPLIIEGIIIRDETVYTAPRAGVLQFSVNSYDRVRPGTEVGSIQNLQEVSGIQQSIYRVEEQIIQLQDIRGNLSAVDPAIHQINGHIRNMVDTRLSRHIGLNISEIYSLRDDITQNVNMRNQMIVAENLDANVRNELGLQHRVLLDELDANRAPVRISAGGILAQTIDGFESLTFENMYYLSPEETRQSGNLNQIILRQEVDYGDDIFKIVNSNRWYIAAYIPSELMDNINTGATIPIYIEGRHDPLNMRVHHIEPGFQESFVILRSTAYMIDFLNLRSIFFRTTDAIQYGLRIANTAITEVINEEGEIEQGVFRVNAGIAAFVPINLSENTPMGSVYTILDPALNPGLRANDHIVINASLVEEGDIVFSGVR